MTDTLTHRGLLLIDAETFYDGPIPPSLLDRIRNDTPAAARERRLAALREQIDHYAAEIAQLRAMKPGQVRGLWVMTAASLAAEIERLTTSLAAAERHYRETALSESHAAIERAAGYRWPDGAGR